jgi:hypothetical protein
MAVLSLEQQIAAAPALVGAFFVPQRMPYWYAAEMESNFEILGGSPDFAVGQKVRITGKLGAREITLTAVVTIYEWGRTLEWRFQDAYGVKGLQSWTIEPGLQVSGGSAGTGGGAGAEAGAGTLVRMRDEYEMPGRIGRAWDFIFMRHAVRRRDQAWLQRLARLMERQFGSERVRD